VALDISRGLAFLHQTGVIHRDIKASNVLLTEHGRAKIADVGLATTSSAFSATASAAGTWAYAAPELLGANIGVKCTFSVDIYSLGVVLWELVTHEMPFRGQLEPVDPDKAPPEVLLLLERCISDDIEGRPTAAEVVKILEEL